MPVCETLLLNRNAELGRGLWLLAWAWGCASVLLHDAVPHATRVRLSWWSSLALLYTALPPAVLDAVRSVLLTGHACSNPVYFVLGGFAQWVATSRWAPQVKAEVLWSGAAGLCLAAAERPRVVELVADIGASPCFCACGIAAAGCAAAANAPTITGLPAPAVLLPLTAAASCLSLSRRRAETPLSPALAAQRPQTPVRRQKDRLSPSRVRDRGDEESSNASGRVEFGPLPNSSFTRIAPDYVRDPAPRERSVSSASNRSHGFPAPPAPSYLPPSPEVARESRQPSPPKRRRAGQHGGLRQRLTPPAARVQPLLQVLPEPDVDGCPTVSALTEDSVSAELLAARLSSSSLRIPPAIESPPCDGRQQQHRSVSQASSGPVISPRAPRLVPHVLAGSMSPFPGADNLQPGSDRQCMTPFTADREVGVDGSPDAAALTPPPHDLQLLVSPARACGGVSAQEEEHLEVEGESE